jgi:hypothetical protein
LWFILRLLPNSGIRVTRDNFEMSSETGIKSRSQSILAPQYDVLYGNDDAGSNHSSAELTPPATYADSDGSSSSFDHEHDEMALEFAFPRPPENPHISGEDFPFCTELETDAFKSFLRKWEASVAARRIRGKKSVGERSDADNESDFSWEAKSSVPHGDEFVGAGAGLVDSHPNVRKSILHGLRGELTEEKHLDETIDRARIAYSHRTRAKELCFLPLAVDQAGAAIAGGLCDMGDYLQMYYECRQTLLAHRSFEGASSYGRAVYTTWELSFLTLEAKMAKGKSEMDAQAAESAIVILQTFAFFHFDGIAEDIFRRATEKPKDGTDVWLRATSSLPHQLLNCNKNGKWDLHFFREGIQILISYSLIKKSNSGVYSMHPLVHCWIRDRMLQPEQQTRCMSAKALLAQSITFQFASQDYAFHRTLLPHIKANE